MAYHNPATQASKTVGQIPGQVSPYLQPYNETGTQALNTSQQQYGNLVNNNANSVQQALSMLLTNPQQALSMLGSGYQESPGYQWDLNQGESAINNAQAAGGMAGSPQHEQEAGELAENLSNKYYQQYLENVLGLFHTGLSGSTDLYKTGLSGENNLAHLGYQSANDLASVIAQSLMQQANLQYAGQSNQNQHRGNIIGNAAGAALSFL